jgi:hypothetical protein
VTASLMAIEVHWRREDGPEEPERPIMVRFRPVGVLEDGTRCAAAGGEADIVVQCPPFRARTGEDVRREFAETLDALFAHPEVSEGIALAWQAAGHEVTADHVRAAPRRVLIRR